MALPVPTNCTFDTYRGANAPPAAPDVAAVRGKIIADYAGAMEHLDAGSPSTGRYTHVMLVEPGTDIRDGYQGSGTFMGGAALDRIYIPDKNGTKYNVTMVEIVGKGSPDEHKRVFLDRMTPTWPNLY